jgi:hypothetical protein
MSRLLTSLLVMLLGAWPARPVTRGSAPRARRGRRIPSRLGADDSPDAVEAPARSRARTFGTHSWHGEAIFAAGDRRTVVPGRWRLTLDRSQRAQTLGATAGVSLDADYPEVWETELEKLLTLQVPGARLRVAGADASGWRVLEVRVPTHPETVVQLDRRAVGQLLDADPDAVRVELRVFAASSRPL